MGIRFRKYFTFGKVFRFNLSKSGVSATIGVKGASVNIGKNGTYLNTGIPGTGIYSREKLSSNQNKKNHSQEAIIRAQNVLDEYDIQQREIKKNKKKSDIAPEVNMEELDDLVMIVSDFVVSEDCPSISQIKKKFNLSYSQAEKIMNQLEHIGIVSSSSATQGRKVLISTQAFNELKNKLNI